MPMTTTAYLADGRHIEVPEVSVSDWQYDVRNGDTTLGLADWYTEQGDLRQDEILGTANNDGLRCGHEETSHRVTNESQIGDFNPDAPLRMARVCHRRACILDALAWVERGTGERAAWAAPHQDYSFDVPADIPDPAQEGLSATGTALTQRTELTVLAPERLQRLRDSLYWYPADPFNPKPWAPHPDGEAPDGWQAYDNFNGHCVASGCSRDDLAALLDEVDRLCGNAAPVVGA